MRKLCLLIALFLFTPGAAMAGDYGAPVPLDPRFMQGISGGPIKPVTRDSQTNKPQNNNKPGNNKPASNNKPVRGR